MNEGPGLDLGRPRQTGELFREALLVIFRQPGTFLAVATAIVVPVELAVFGVGLEQLSAGYSEKISTAEVTVSSTVSFLVIAPLVTAATIRALADMAEGERASAARSLQAGLDAFTPVFLAVTVAALGILLGLVALIVPGIYVFVRWYFVPQAVMIDGMRGLGALTRSGEVVQGSWWRVAATVLLANLLVALVSVPVLAPVQAAARAADREVVALAGTIVLDVLTVPYLAVLSTLLFYDLRARRRLVG